jgi:SanA protein
MSDILQDRVDTAIELYKAKKVNKLIMSGAENEAESMTKYALKNGVSEKDVIKDPKGLSTIESIRNAKDYDEMIIVTQSFHMPRSIYLARHLGIDAVGMVSDKRTYEKIFDFTKREILASSNAMMELLMQ